MSTIGSINPKKTAVFDLDGTLIDSQSSILGSIKRALSELDIESKIPLSKQLIGPPLMETLGRICGTTEIKTLNDVSAKFKQIYDDVGYKDCVSYQGIEVLLDDLIKCGYTLKLATNKRLVPTQKIINHLKWDRYFRSVYTIDSNTVPLKNKAEILETLVRETKDKLTSMVYVGDRYEDYQASMQNNIKCILVNWGYGEEFPAENNISFVRSPDELFEAILRTQ